MRVELSFIAHELRRAFFESLNGSSPNRRKCGLVANENAGAPEHEDFGVHRLDGGCALDSRPPGPEQPADDDFNRFALRLFHLQHVLNGPYRAVCDARGVTPANTADWQHIPAVSTSAFKGFAFSCLPESERITSFESSGTTQATHSKHYHSRASLGLYRASLLPWFRRHVLPETVDVRKGASNYRGDFISLTPPLLQAPHSSLVHMLDTVSRLECFQDTRFVGNLDERGAWTLNLEAFLAAVRESRRQARPVTLAGTAFNHVHLLDALDGSPLCLPPGSRIMETGGYKGRSRELSRDALHTELARQLGVPRHSIVTEYGMTELGSQAYDRIVGNGSMQRMLKFPPWARAMVVSCETGLEVAVGESGLVRIVDLANAFSVVAVETEDLAIRRRDGIELMGRRAMAEPRGCSLMTL